MANRTDSKVLELFGQHTSEECVWAKIVKKQWCPFTNTKCFKIRKSQPDTSIGTCTVRYGASKKDIIICPQSATGTQTSLHGLPASSHDARAGKRDPCGPGGL